MALMGFMLHTSFPSDSGLELYYNLPENVWEYWTIAGTGRVKSTINFYEKNKNNIPSTLFLVSIKTTQ